MTFKTIDDLGDIAGKTALVRVDLNVPMLDGKVSDNTRLDAVKATVDVLCGKGARVMLLAHFGRPKGQVVPEMSLAPVVPFLADVLGRPVGFGVMGEALPKDDVIVLENTRFYPGEETNDPALAFQFAALGDVYVNDAFSCAHRAHASTEAIAKLLPSAAGVTMAAELAALEKALGNPQRPVAAVVGGAKVSSKLTVLENLVTKVDHLIIGGGMANTFLYAMGNDVGASLCEKDLKNTALHILQVAEQSGCIVHLPEDVVVAREFKAMAESKVKAIYSVEDGEMILDVGPASVKDLADTLQDVKTLVWNGPMGAFEMAPFDQGTVSLAREAAKYCDSGRLLAVAGGGDTVAALAHAGVKDSFTHISTAGGAFLEWMEGKELPGVAALEK